MSLYEMLKNGVSLEELEKNLHLFNTHSDAEVTRIMNDDEISYAHKEFLVDHCFDRINQLPKELWLECMTFVTNQEVFIKFYIPKVESLSYEDLVFLLRNMCQPECGLTILNTAIFSRYLEIEKENNGTVLQSFLLSSKIYLYDKEKDRDFTSLNEIGEEVATFVKKQEAYVEDVNDVIDMFLNAVLEYREEMDITHPVLQRGMDLVKHTISKNILLSPQMLKFYLLYVAKNLNIDDYVQDVYVSMEEKTSAFASYQESSKRVTIYYDFILNNYGPVFNQMAVNEMIQNQFFNYEYIFSVLHELGHVVESKKKESIFNFNSRDDCMKNDLFFYWWYNGNLKISNPQSYELKHDSFINEVRADLFSIMHFSAQTNHLLKGTFSENYLALLSAQHAGKIVKFYTEKTEKGRKVISPTKQFTEFYNENMPKEEQISFLDTEDTNIMNNLLLGNKVPFEVIVEINKIATGKRITTNLYEEIVRIIEEYQNAKIVERENTTFIHK